MGSSPRIVKIVKSCGDGCPHYGYYSGNRHTCSLVDQIVLDKTSIAPFCPLPHYPSEPIAGLMQTIDAARTRNDYALPWAVMSFVAAKLRTRLSGDGRTIRLSATDKKHPSVIIIDIEYIMEIQLPENRLRFQGMDGQKYGLNFSPEKAVLVHFVDQGDGLELCEEIPFTVEKV